MRPTNEIFEEMLAQARIKPADVAGRVARARDVAYWRSLAPALTIGGRGPEERSANGVDADVLQAADDLARDGVFYLANAIERAHVDAACSAVDAVTAARWPPLFAFVYDEVWRAARAPGSWTSSTVRSARTPRRFLTSGRTSSVPPAMPRDGRRTSMRSCPSGASPCGSR